MVANQDRAHSGIKDIPSPKISIYRYVNGLYPSGVSTAGLLFVILAVLIFPFSVRAAKDGDPTPHLSEQLAGLELVIIDGQVESRYQMADHVKPGREVVVLDGDEAAVLQISRILTDYNNLSAIHLISHGTPGELVFTNSRIGMATVRRFTSMISDWGRALSSTGDILLYGCHVGEKGQGREFVQTLSDITGADVAASTNLTGHSDDRADLFFERSVGEISTSAVMTVGYRFGPLQVFDWTSEGWTPDGTGSMPRSYTDIDGSGVDADINITGNIGNYADGTPALDNDPGPDSLWNSLDFSNLQQSVTITFSFSEPVNINSLTLMDIDRGSGRRRWRWHDRFTVIGGTESGSINPSSIDAGTLVNVIDNSTVEGVGYDLDADDFRGWAVFAFQDDPVTSVSITYSPGSRSRNNPDRQWMWIGDIDFFVPTLAVISSFYADGHSGQIGINWRTVAEIGTVGFHLQRLNEVTGKYERINERLLPGLLHETQGGTYRYVDQTADPNKTHFTYKLIEVEANGKTRSYGPFPVSVNPVHQIISGGTVSDGTVSENLANAKVARQTDLIRPASGKKYHRSAHTRKKARGASSTASNLSQNISAAMSGFVTTNRKANSTQLKIEVAKTGLYYLEASDIAEDMGESVENIQKWIKKKKLSLTNQGQPVAWLAAEENAGLYFYGEEITSLYSDRNIYWLSKGKGRVMKKVENRIARPGSGYDTFFDHRHEEENRYAKTALYTDPEDDYWLWDVIISGYQEHETKDFFISANGAAGIGEARLVVRLKGTTDTDANPDHHAIIGLNGQTIGEGRWNGTDLHELELTFNGSLLIDGENRVTVSGQLDTGAEYSIFYLDALDLYYERYYRAVDDAIWVKRDGNKIITVEGFTSRHIFVLDVSDPWKPRCLQRLEIDGEEGNYRVSFKPKNDKKSYLVVADSAISPPVSVVSRQPSLLDRTDTGADYVVIAPEIMVTAANRLADYRNGTGFSTMVVELEDIYDTFNYGIVHSEAIHDFLSFAHYNWENGPQFIVLAGSGHYDYLDHSQFGDNWVPPIMVSTPFGLFASDNHYADVEGEDGLPDLRIGRLPAETSEDLEAMIDKIITYETGSSGEWINRVFMLADDPDDGGNFPADSDAVADLISPNFSVEKVYLSDYDIDVAREEFLDGIDSGAWLVNHLGHAGLDRLAQEGLLVSDDVASLNNDGKFPLFSLMACLTGRFEVPGFETLGEVLMSQPSAGAVAVWAPTGLSVNTANKALNEALFEAIFMDEEKILGDAINIALNTYADSGKPSYLWKIFTLLGDPALVLK